MAKSKFELALQETENQRQILSAHNISEQVSGAALTDSLPSAVAKTMQLTNPDKEDVYVPDSYFAQLEIDFENDPLRTKNGGTYPYCSYYVIAADYETSYFSVNSTALLVFSDDTTLTGASTYTKVWDSSKDLIDGAGRKCRLVKRYDLTQVSSVCPCYETSTATAGLSPLRFMIWQSSTTLFTVSYTASPSTTTITACYKLEYAVIDALVTSSGTATNFSGCSSLVCIKGGILTINKSSTNSFAYRCYALKYTYLKFSIMVANDASALYKECYNVQDIDIYDTTVLNLVLSYAYASVLYPSSRLKNIKIDNLQRIEAGAYITQPGTELKIITLPSSLTYIAPSIFTYCYGLEILNIYTNFNITGINLSACYLLTKDCLNHIITNLADRTGDTAGTMIFGVTNLAKLNDDEIALATNKNWTLS